MARLGRWQRFDSGYSMKRERRVGENETVGLHSLKGVRYNKKSGAVSYCWGRWQTISEPKRLAGFIGKNKWAILLSVGFAFTAYAFMLTHYDLTIDEETWIGNEAGSLGWVSQGRFGLWLMNLLVAPGGSYVPMLWDWLAVLLWCLSGPVLLYTLQGYFPGLKKLHVFFFCAYFSCVPFATGELLSYSMFNLQMSIAMLCVTAACWLSMLYKKTEKKVFLVPAALLLFFSVSVYQAFITVYVTWCCACLLLDILNRAEGGYRRDYRQLLWLAVAGLAAVCGYLLVNSLLNRYLVAQSGYLTQTYVGWTQGGNVLTTLALALANVVRVSFAVNIMDHPIYAGVAICITTCAFILAMLFRIKKAKNGKRRAHLFLSSLLLLIAPFSLFIALGAYNTHGRALIGLPLLGAIQWVIVLATSDNKKYTAVVSVVLTAVLAYNAVAMNRLFYDSHQVYMDDRETAREVMAVIDENGYDYSEKPLVFVGMYDTGQDREYVSSGSTGGSFFSWDDGNISRINHFLAAEGYDVHSPGPAEIESALIRAQQLPEWPDAGSVVEEPGFILVKLSEPTETWYVVNGLR